MADEDDILGNEDPIPLPDDDASPASKPEPKKIKKVINKKKLKRITEDMNRRGIIYISRIPPHMKPMKLKHLLSQYGEVERVYCAPEDSRLRMQRKREKGSNTGKNFTEGWVEFLDKNQARDVAERLNGNPIGGRKRNAFYYDLWCMKYLKGFKWDHLTEEVNYQKAVREQKLVVEIANAKRERDFYLQKVDQAKANAAINDRRAAKAKKEDK
uniref:RRM domain-containing protein n=1 Tax=Polytomella parva TaxID=51329 RepID=A0A7S0VBQ3_9CHLO|mmetsp:Transcript_34696/g.62474  ORF Transcript_34696/g.62474 Transcript_34696/m.62474 type:complete len:213 (+) Transcript_34696:48-686(+)